jgi:carboxylesterase type B
MQAPIFDDMRFRSNGMSEDCLYLNVWTPAKSNRERLPVLVYFYGGGFVSGDSSEPRYDGESMATKGIVVVTVNYRLGVFGFMALGTAEHHEFWWRSKARHDWRRVCRLGIGECADGFAALEETDCRRDR